VRSFLLLLTGLALARIAAAGEPTGLQSIGAAIKVSRLEDGVRLDCADGASLRLTVLAPDLVRVRALFAGQADQPDHSWAIDRRSWAAVPWQLDEAAATVTLTTAELEVVVRRNPVLVEFREAADHRLIKADFQPMARDPQTGRVAAFKRLGLDEHFYGLGEKAAHLDKRRGRFEMWNSDTPGYVEGTDPIYQSIPFYLGWQDGEAYGIFFDNSFRSVFDFGHSGQDEASFTADGGELNYYFFRGPAMKKILGRYADLTGHMPLPPQWALGNQQCRYSYYPAAMVEKIARLYRAHDLPLDVLYLDIHYMNDYRDFTWNPKRFPDPAGLLGRLGQEGIKVVTIVDPGVKYQPLAPGAPAAAEHPDRGPQDQSYYVFNQGLAGDYFLRRKDGSLYIGAVWPGPAVFVDYTLPAARRWWGDLHRPFLDEGVSGFWDDMNEPSDFVDKSGATQADVIFNDEGAHTTYARNRNLFALNMARATCEGLERLRPDRRPFIVTRAGYAGVQRYATMWTGDNNATFDSLALNVPMFASLGLSGEPFVGADLPGFIGRGDAELLARDYEVAFLTPLCRNHGALDGYDHEPWRFGAYAEGIVRKYLKLRYRLMPFLYTTLEEAHRTGVPLFRPLLLNFQDDPNTLNLDDEFMVGEALLAAPVLRADARGREVYLPRGRWYDFWTGAGVAGGETARVDVPLDHVPLYVRGGSVIPSTESMNFVGEKPWDPIRFDIYPDENGRAAGSLYEDDGITPAYRTGFFRRTSVQCAKDAAGIRLSLAAPAGAFQPGARRFELVLHGASAVTGVLLDGINFAPTVGTAAGPGWRREGGDSVVVRFDDDSRAHEIQLH
jgi:alpha-glucosidase